MPERTARYLAYFGAAIVLAFVIDIGFDVLARWRIAHQPFAEALSESAHYLLVQPIGLALSLAPFVAVAWICGSLDSRSRPRALWLFAACIAAFAYLHYVGHTDAQTYMRQRMWTAAALAAGTIPFKSAVVVLIALGLRFLLARNRETARP